MKCTYCGAPIEEGRIFCLKCGEEIVWVPEYDAIGTYRTQSEREVMEAARRAVENDQKRQDEAVAAEAELAAIKKKKRRKWIWITVLIVFLLLGVGVYFGVKYYIDQRNNNSFEYQHQAAQIEYDNREYDLAKNYIDRALELDSDSVDAIFMKSDILLGQGHRGDAAQVLLDLVAKRPDNIEAYGRIIKIYEDGQQPGEIKELLAKCQESMVLEHYNEYIVEKPVINLPSGEYNELSQVEIYPHRGVAENVYYTLDESEPTAESTLYTKAINMGEGVTVLKVIAINDKNISSDIVEMTYFIELLPPEPPVISPASGEFTTETDNKIHVDVPDGCTAYYAFDERPTTSSTQYTQNIDMLEGQHTFYAILVDKNGKQSEPGTAIYNLTGDENVPNQ